jgi:hypothetical protein
MARVSRELFRKTAPVLSRLLFVHSFERQCLNSVRVCARLGQFRQTMILIRGLPCDKKARLQQARVELTSKAGAIGTALVCESLAVQQMGRFKLNY